jgi:protein-disulfide isomerase
MFRSNIGPGRIRLFSVIAAVTLSLFIISCQGTVSVPGSVDFGDADSPVRIELFTDYQCPVCTRFHDEVESALIRELVDNRGFLFRVTPVALLGEESALAGAYALAARDLGRFEEFAALLYGAQTEINSGTYTEENLRQLASGIGLDTARMESAVERNGYLDVIAGNTAIARNLGISGPPSFAIVYTLDEQRRYELIQGFVSLPVFIDYLDQVEALIRDQ